MGIIACYIYDEMVDWEVTYACHILSQGPGDKQKQITTISTDGSDIRSCSGLRFVAETRVRNIIEQPAVEGLIIPEGFCHEDCEELSTLIRILYKQEKLLAAICAGPIFLARAGVLKDVHYTTMLAEEFFTIQKIADPFPRQNYTAKDIVWDKNVLTAKFNAFLEFGVEICDRFGFFNSPAEKKESLQVFKTVRC
ncbi:MAG: DJ-1/PfpI family protein [Spirochaetales bacterium]|nr:DJ-1/PfpI family protein [Spirochaetales bacterium]